MAKLKMKKSRSLALPEPIGNTPQTATISRCQIDIPGVGRIRTGERHPDFHFIEDSAAQSDDGVIKKAAEC